jgi:hypothetical protein
MSYRRANIEAIKRLGAKEVAVRLGLVEQESRTHYKFAGYEGSAWIRFYDNDTTWHGFKHHAGGDCISLVQASLSGAPDFEVNPSLFLEACRQIAQAFDLWAEPPHAAARALAKTKRTYDDAYVYMDAIVETIETDRGGNPWGVASQVFEALDLDPHSITLAPDASGTGCLCWQPAVPWQGVRISRDVKEYNGVEKEIYGGWTKERAHKHVQDPDALRIIMHDFDGINARNVKPKIGHIEHIMRGLRHRGLSPAVVVWSSYGEEDEAKAHMYWKSPKASSVDQWLRRWAFLKDVIADIASELGEDIAETLAVDSCTEQVQRLARVPGYTPFGADMASTIASCPGVEVDLDAMMERQDITWRQFVDGGKTITYTLGQRCIVETEMVVGDEPVTTKKVVANNIWPVARWMDGKDMGLVVRLERHGETVYTHMKAGQLVERKSRSKIVIDLANIGAQILPGGDKAISQMIANAYQWQPVLVDRVVELETRPGWHGDIYVQSEGIFEDHKRSFFATGDRIRRRGHTQGTTEEWVKHVASLATTPALALGLLTSFAGALVRRTGQHPFIVHMHCRSSQGKSSASTLAASVWGPGEVSGNHGLYYSWNVTATYPEVIAEAATDACAIMDDTSKWRGTDEELANVIHLFGGTMGRGRCYNTGEGQPLRRWYCTTLSNGETGLLDQIGNAAIGGHFVRVLDVEIGQGECATDAHHADAMRHAANEFYGSVSQDWIKRLQAISNTELLEFQEHYLQLARFRVGTVELSSEQQRTLRIVALLWMTGQFLINDGLVPWTTEFLEGVIDWIIARVIRVRAEALDSPEYRYAARLVDYIDEDERHAPKIDHHGDLSCRPSNYIGYRDGNKLYILSQRLRAVRLTKEISGAKWLKWALRQDGLVIGRSRQMIAGENRNWWVLDFEALEQLQNQIDDGFSGNVTENFNPIGKAIDRMESGDE